MKLLLDTHSFIWWDSAPDRLSQAALDLCRDQTNLLMLSIASIWEMQIKSGLGKLTFKTPLRETIQDHQARNNFSILPITLNHVLAIAELPLYHRDPFDRLLVAQAIVEGATMISRDPDIAKYSAKVIW